MTNRTEAQKKAIETIGENLAVNAGAGTGKTKVLTERYIEILDKGILDRGKEIESIVAITFTKKATQEMKERIRKEIRSRFGLEDRWRDYYRDMEKANISTIHSFCGNILKENPLEANIDPLFTIMDDLEGSQLLQAIILDNLKKNTIYKEDLYNILILLEQDELDYLAGNLYSLYNKAKSNGDSMETLREKTLEGINSIDIPQDIDQSIIRDFDFLMSETRANSKFNKLKNEEIWTSFINGELVDLRRLEALGEFMNYIGANKKNEEVVDRLTNNISIALLEKEKSFIWAYEIIFKILLDVEREYEFEKNKASLLDYNDLEYKTFELLRDNKTIREKYQDKYSYIMVDEFQDTNELQKNIFYYLCSRDSLLDRENLFVVGDPKQSIYGFRGADVGVFEGVISDIEKISDNPPINMDKNFRSLDVIIDFVNNIFSPLIERYIPLNFHHLGKDIRDIEIIEVDDLEEPEGVSKASFNKMYEASVMADRIDELVKSKEYSYGDFAFLFRASTNDIIYEEALRMRNIPFYNSGGASLYDRQEVKDILNLLKFISNSFDLLSAIGFLRSPMVALNDESIYFILSSIKDGNIFDGIKNIKLEDELENRKLYEAYNLVLKYKYEKDIYSITTMLKNILRDVNFIDILLLYEDGEQRVNNVYKFIDIVKSYEMGDKESLESFIDYMDSVEELAIKESQAKIRSENADVVKIMTIHKSKGLQFPVVLLPEMSRASRNEVDNLIYNRSIGMGFKYEKKASLYETIKDKNREEDEEEMKRILYVGMTRAEKLLILGNQGSDKGFKKLLSDLEGKGSMKYLDYDFKYIDLGNKFKEIDETLTGISDDGLLVPNLMEFDNYKSKHFNSINISQFIEFKKCRRQFYYNYYKALPENSFRIGEEKAKNILPPIDRGHIIHKFCEDYRGEENYLERLKNIVEYYGYDYSNGVENELIGFVDNYMEFYRREYDKIYSEENFYLKIEDTFISGIIDRIYIKDNKAYVYDFKTNIVGDREDLKKFYSPQLQIYAYAVEKMFDIEVESAAILFLENGDIVDIDIDRESLLNNLEEIVEFINFIENHSQIEDYEKGIDCDYCMYEELCR